MSPSVFHASWCRPRQRSHSTPGYLRASQVTTHTRAHTHTHTHFSQFESGVGYWFVSVTPSDVTDMVLHMAPPCSIRYRGDTAIQISTQICCHIKSSSCLPDPNPFAPSFPCPASTSLQVACFWWSCRLWFWPSAKVLVVPEVTGSDGSGLRATGPRGAEGHFLMCRAKDCSKAVGGASSGHPPSEILLDSLCQSL